MPTSNCKNGKTESDNSMLQAVLAEGIDSTVSHLGWQVPGGISHVCLSCVRKSRTFLIEIPKDGWKRP